MAERISQDIIGNEQNSPMVDVYSSERKLASTPEERLKKIAEQYSKELGKDYTPPEEEESDLMDIGGKVLENLAEMPTAVGVGAVHAVQEVGNTAIALIDAVENYSAEKFGHSADILFEEGQKLRFAELTPEMKTPAGKITKFMTQLFVGMKGLDKVFKYGKHAKGAGKVLRNMALGAGSEAIATSTDDGMAVDMFYEFFPEAKNPVMDYLASNPKDTEAEKRFKKFTEGFFLEGLAEVVFKAFKLVRAKRVQKSVAKDTDDVLEEMGQQGIPANKQEALSPEEVAQVKADRRADLPPTPEEEGLPPTPKEGLPPTPKDDLPLTPEEEGLPPTPKDDLPPTPKDDLPPTPEQEGLPPDTLNGEILKIKQEVKARRQAQKELPPIPTPKDPKYPDLYNIKDTDGVRKAIKKMVKGEHPTQEAAKETITRDQMQEYAAKLGVTFENLEEVITKEGYSAVELQALVDLTKKSADNAYESILKIDPENISKADELEVYQHLEQLETTTSILRPAASDQGRGLELLKQVADVSKKDRLYKELKRKYGKDAVPHIVKAMKEIEARGGIDNYLYWKALVDRPFYVKIADASTEFLINRFLGSVATQSVNLFSNAFNTATQPVVRKYAEVLSEGLEESVQRGEAGAYFDVITSMESLKDAFQAATLTWKTGKSKFYTKYDLNLRSDKGIDRPDMMSAAAFDLEGTAVGKTLDMLGKASSLPSKMLNSADEFFKFINQRGELHALAVRESKKTQMIEGLTDLETEALRQKLLKDPTFEMQVAAKKQAEYATYTQSLNDINMSPRGLGKLNFSGLEQDLRGNVLGRVVAPFIRTPTNIVAQTLEHTPIAYIQDTFGKAMREGGAARDIALAKVSFGSTVMGFGAYLAANGVITGDGPTDYRARIALEKNGNWKANSLKTPKGYIPLSSLGIMGEVLAKSAQLAEVLGTASRTDDGERDEIGTEAGAYLVSLYTPDFLSQGISDVLLAREGNKQALERLGRSTVGQMSVGRTSESIRGLFGSVALDKSPRGEDRNKIWQSIINNFKAGFPQDFVEAAGGERLYPRLNLMGKEIKFYGLYQDEYEFGALGGEIHPEIAKFIGEFNNTARNLLEDRSGYELFRLTMPPRALDVRQSTKGGTIKISGRGTYELNNEQYYKYVKYSAGLDRGKISGGSLENRIVGILRSTKNNKAMTPVLKMQLIRQTINQYRKNAENILMQEYPEIRREMYKESREELERKVIPRLEI